MVKITEQLLRKKSEHNELIIFSLEELSLHQENIERIEHVQDFCRELKILLLQSNLIPKIGNNTIWLGSLRLENCFLFPIFFPSHPECTLPENLNKLKKLEYLNLAINNIARIENLKGCESLQKLDLTLNFIWELTSVERLAGNIHLRELFLTGNPCTDYSCYRDYVIVALPQLTTLDGTEITRTERLRAAKKFEENRREVIQLQAKYQISRDEQKLRVENEIQAMENVDLDDEAKLKEFWNMKSENCPEMRCEIAQKSRKRDNQIQFEQKAKKSTPKLFADCGRPYCLNMPKLNFVFHDEMDRYELDLHVYKFLDTSLIGIDVQPNYVRVTIKGKIFQIALNDEVRTDASTSQRSMATGHLLVTMPKLKASELVVIPDSTEKFKASTAKSGEKGELKAVVNIRNLVIDESEIPPLI